MNIKTVCKKLGVGLCLFSSIASPIAVFAQEQTTQVDLSAKSAMAIDATNGQILFESNSKKPVEIASITKLMTVYLTYKAIDEGKLSLDTKVSISDHAYAISQDYNIANVPLRQDVQYKVGDLLESIGITLANGSAVALAEQVAGSEEAFAKQMNQQLADWGIQGTDLVNATGLSDKYQPQDKESIKQGEQQKLSAEAVAVISYHLVKEHPEFLKYTQTPKKFFQKGTDDEFEMRNYNEMLAGRQYEYEGVDGLIIGSAAHDGEALVSTTQRNGFRVISVALGSEDSAARYDDSKRMYDYVYAAYMSQHVVSKGDKVTQGGDIESANARQATVPLSYGRDLDLVVPVVDTTPRLDYQFSQSKSYFNNKGQLKAPLKAKTVVGQMTIRPKGANVHYLPSAVANKVDVVNSQEVKEAPWYLKVWRFLVNLVIGIMEWFRKFFTSLFN
ncbi:D-alanyl-D-alanine carboxypeptidase family protein [Vaginisenegalia massiliensis]|uniref:D-alanyl-D-alanine carboxypeptidase family protein n=1 Tax=Vaginisenegalia massiliensis TaxID=2058294 RepID=UPI000F541119|nr:D-alanyl-D-alanine carboxypeptidase family protein [Vaginisenegalia massiliensis]